MSQPSPEHRQRVHELRAAHIAARHLENALEMCIGWAPATEERRRTQRIRQAIAAELIALGVPMGDFQ